MARPVRCASCGKPNARVPHNALRFCDEDCIRLWKGIDLLMLFGGNLLKKRTSYDTRIDLEEDILW